MLLEEYVNFSPAPRLFEALMVFWQGEKRVLIIAVIAFESLGKLGGCVRSGPITPVEA